MQIIDLITLVQLLLGLLIAIAAYILIRRGKLPPKLWPRVFGIGGGVYGFISLMITSVLLRPASDATNYIIENLFWSLMLGIVGYFGTQKYARRFHDDE